MRATFKKSSTQGLSPRSDLEREKIKKKNSLDYPLCLQNRWVEISQEEVNMNCSECPNPATVMAVQFRECTPYCEVHKPTQPNMCTQVYTIFVSRKHKCRHCEKPASFIEFVYKSTYFICVDCLMKGIGPLTRVVGLLPGHDETSLCCVEGCSTPMVTNLGYCRSHNPGSPHYDRVERDKLNLP